MNLKTLDSLVTTAHAENVAFRPTFYDVNAPDRNAKKRQWAELVKAILSFANGSATLAGQTSYLLFGFSAEQAADGQREIFDIGELSIDRQQILSRINNTVSPPLSDLDAEVLIYRGKRTLAITIPPSPYLHETTKKLETPDQSYAEYTVFARRGSDAVLASLAEIQAISAAKKPRIGEAQAPLPASHTPPAAPEMQSSHREEPAEPLRQDQHAWSIDLLFDRVLIGTLAVHTLLLTLGIDTSACDRSWLNCKLNALIPAALTGIVVALWVKLMQYLAETYYSLRLLYGAFAVCLVVFLPFALTSSLNWAFDIWSWLISALLVVSCLNLAVVGVTLFIRRRRSV